ncbi:MAG: hypothetical protein L7H03_01830 [Vulcanisaeta sp.]|jgi:hypothetical protein|nr:MAG: hypothetical protein AT716_00060 [Vulcanisaeta sp. MG_3]KUO92735.1 MAG: hypothetical protein AT717_00185 [Vulcanisaeta sp. CIS_19]MCG2865957.1 hypothetical protein [Vulcanisaeta sp.]MCG2885214.1 hypothetical protein [Vulcanisaeta sp.]
MKSSLIQRELKALVDGVLKSLEVKSLRYTRVSVRDSKQGLEVSIKIYLESPIRFNSISEVIKALTSKYGIAPSDVMIYAPHTRAIKLLFTLKR